MLILTIRGDESLAKPGYDKEIRRRCFDMRKRSTLVAFVMAAILLPMCVPLGSAHELVASIPGGPTTPSYVNEAVSYVYPYGKNGQVSVGGDKPVKAYVRYKTGDYIMTMIVTLESLHTDYEGSREANLMVSVFYTYCGDRSKENKGGLANIYIGMSKTITSGSLRYDYCASFISDLREDQRWYPHGFKDNNDLGEIVGTLYGGFGKALGKAADLVPGGQIAGKSVEFFYSWLGKKAAQGLHRSSSTGYSGLSAAIDMRNTHYPFNYDVDEDSSTIASDAYDFVGSFLVKLRYERSISSGSVFGLRFTFEVCKGDSTYLSTTSHLRAPRITFSIKMS
jgi:hypothetical protein